MLQERNVPVVAAGFFCCLSRVRRKIALVRLACSITEHGLKVGTGPERHDRENEVNAVCFYLPDLLTIISNRRLLSPNKRYRWTFCGGRESACTP